jgi:glycolate oxidase iron-sulfur subunit
VVRRLPLIMRWLPEKIRNLIALAPTVDASAIWHSLPERTASSGPARLRVGLLTGCVQRVFFGHVNEATARVLAAEGCDVIAPRSQGCCGALALHAGRDREARDFARQLIATFESSGVDQIVVNAAGCGSTMKTYGDLLKEDPAWSERARLFSAKVRDATETLAELGAPRSPRHRIDLRVAYHDACHLAHAQGVRVPPRAALTSIPGIILVPLAESDICCGSAGIFNLVQPEMAGELGRRKAARIAESQSDVVATSNPGCILQIAAAGRATGQETPVYHVMELLDAAINNSGKLLSSRRLPRAPVPDRQHRGL